MATSSSIHRDPDDGNLPILSADQKRELVEQFKGSQEFRNYVGRLFDWQKQR